MLTFYENRVKTFSRNGKTQFVLHMLDSVETNFFAVCTGAKPVLGPNSIIPYIKKGV